MVSSTIPIIKRPASYMDDEIVHAMTKVVGKCNQLVAGSNPASGAKIKYRPLWSLFYFDFRKAKFESEVR